MASSHCWSSRGRHRSVLPLSVVSGVDELERPLSEARFRSGYILLGIDSGGSPSSGFL